MRRRAVAIRAIALTTLLLLGGCARTVSVATDPASIAAIEVSNETGATMIVEYQADAGRATLGAITAGSTERFIITLPAGTTIAVSARSDTGARTAGPYSVTLRAGHTERITLR